MKRVVQFFKEIAHGNADIRPNVKFTILMICVGLMHLSYLFGFIYLDMPILVGYNTLSVLFYIFLSYTIYHTHYSFSYTGCFIEVNIHALLTTYLLGFECGYTLFCIALIPIAFYMAFSLSAFRRSLVTPTLFAVVSLIVTLICRIISYYITSFYTPLTQSQLIWFYCFNATITFFLLVLFSLFFIFEIRNAQLNLEKQNRYLDNLAHLDSLTRLLNRRSMHEQLVAARENAICDDSPFCLVLCDIDDFKKINDTYGHDCGDKVLIHISELIRANVRKEDSVCRWGGEEILLLLNAPMETAYETTERIRRQIEGNPTTYEEHIIHHTMTFGIAPFSQNDSLEAIIRTADKRLYSGKREGKNRVVQS